jgi:hypothetical protein
MATKTSAIYAGFLDIVKPYGLFQSTVIGHVWILRQKSQRNWLGNQQNQESQDLFQTEILLKKMTNSFEGYLTFIDWIEVHSVLEDAEFAEYMFDFR